MRAGARIWWCALTLVALVATMAAAGAARVLREMVVEMTAAATAARPPVDAARSVEQWGVFEATFDGPSKGNPFIDVELT